jgi:hypothetical protein
VLLEGGNMKKEKKNNNTDEFQDFLDKILNFTFWYTVSSIVLIYLGSLSLSRVPLDAPLRSFFVGDVNTWIIFFGTILGGSLTVFGVLYTIVFNLKIKKKEELTRKKNEVTKNRPYIVCDMLKLTQSDQHTVQGTLIFKNISHNPARNLCLDENKSSVNISGIDIRTNISFMCQSIQFIGDNNAQEAFFYIDFPVAECKAPLHCHVHFEFNYLDLVGENIFSHTVLLDGSIDLIKVNKKVSRISYDSGDFAIINEFNWLA